MEPKAYSSATDVAVLPTVRHRGIPDVPEDVDFLMEHLNDPNFDYGAGFRSSMDASTEIYELEHNKTADAYSTMTSDLESHSHRSMRYSTASRTDTPSSSFEYDDESPYPEVRAAVSSVDDPTMPVNTFRMWFLGLSYAVLISGLNQFFSMRYPSVIITGIVAQLTALPLGKGLERVLPTTRFCTLGYTWSLNPGPFNIKEHVVITVMANLVVNGAYATDILATQRSFYNQSLSNSYQYFLVLATQLIGFSLGGLLRRFLVYPCSMMENQSAVTSPEENSLLSLLRVASFGTFCQATSGRDLASSTGYVGLSQPT